MFPTLHTKSLATSFVYRCFMSSPDYWPAFFAQMQLLHSCLEETVLGLFSCNTFFFIVFRVGTFNFSLKDVLFGTWRFLSLVEWKIAHHHNTRRNITARVSEMPCHSPYVLLHGEAMGFHIVLVVSNIAHLHWMPQQNLDVVAKLSTHFKRCRTFTETEVVEWLKTSKEYTVRIEGTVEV